MVVKGTGAFYVLTLNGHTKTKYYEVKNVFVSVGDVYLNQNG